MGLYFNSDGTKLLIKTLNDRYDRSATGLTLNGPVDSPNYADPAMSLYQIWQTFNVHLNTGNSPHGDTNWHSWLNAIASNSNGSATTEVVIKQAMVNYIAANDCNAIEFFAVPSTQILASFPTKVADHDNPGKYSYIISVETVTYDKASAFARANRLG